MSDMILGTRNGGDCQISGCGSPNALVAALAGSMLAELNKFSVQEKTEVAVPALNFSGITPKERGR